MPFTGFQDIHKFHLLVDVVDAIGIVPEDAEVVGSGFHRCQLIYHLVAVADAFRIGMKRHTPDAFDQGILLCKRRNHLHVRPLRS